MKHVFLLIFVVGILEASAEQPICYYPNGREMNAFERTDIYQPCNRGDGISMCCAPWDSCRPDGLCASGFDGNIWRDGCTDPTWQSPSCIKLCDTGLGQYLTGKDMDLTTSTTTVTPCNDGSFCCGNGTLADGCCRQNRGFFLVNGAAQRMNPIYFQGSSSSLPRTTSSSTTTARPATSSSTTTTPSSTASSLTQSVSTASSFTLPISPAIPALTASASSSSGIISPSTSGASSTGKNTSSVNVAAVAGGTVGGVALGFLIAGAALFWHRRRHRNAGNSQVGHPQAGHELLGNDKTHDISEVSSGYHPPELAAPNPSSQFDPSRIRHEAP